MRGPSRLNKALAAPLGRRELVIGIRHFVLVSHPKRHVEIGPLLLVAHAVPSLGRLAADIAHVRALGARRCVRGLLLLPDKPRPKAEEGIRRARRVDRDILLERHEKCVSFCGLKWECDVPSQAFKALSFPIRFLLWHALIMVFQAARHVALSLVGKVPEVAYSE
jgi:hypothetical protein